MTGLRDRVAGLLADRRRRLIAVAAAAVVIVVGAGGITWAAAATPRAESGAPAHRSATAADRGSAGRIQDPVPDAPAAPAGVPVGVAIPSLGVSSSLEDLAVDGTGKLQPPIDPAKAGWYSAGVAPGQVGPAIIAGHIDFSAGPGVFERLHELTPGAEVDVQMSTGENLTFIVSGSLQSPKAQFPAAEVYGNVPDRQLRLIACAGDFDSETHLYLDNLIVFATLAPDKDGS